MESTEGCAFAQLHLWPVIVGYTLFCVTVCVVRALSISSRGLDGSWHPFDVFIKLFFKYLEAICGRPKCKQELSNNLKHLFIETHSEEQPQIIKFLILKISIIIINPV